MPNKECRNGITNWCRKCRYNYCREWKAKNRDKLNKRNRDIYAETNGARQKELEARRAFLFPFRRVATVLLIGIRQRVRERGLPVAKELIKKFVIDWLQRQPNCECCGVAFHIGPKNGAPMDSSPSFDQIIPGSGYLLPNVALICWRCNNIKRNYSASDLRLVAAWIDIKTKKTEHFTIDTSNSNSKA